MKKENKEKEVKYKTFDTNKLKKAELVITIVFGVLLLVMLVLAIINRVFVPLTLVSLAMLLFSICYYYIDDKNKKKLVYILFTIGVLVIVAEVIFTLVNVL